MDALFSDYEAIRKSGLFDPEYYLATYPDVAERNVDPLVHYLEEGAQEGRNPHPDFDSAYYLEQCGQRGERPANPLMHYIRLGAARGLNMRRAGDRRAAAPRPAAGRERRLPVLVALEALGVVGAPDGKLRLSASGWALASSPITEIALTMDDEVIGIATYGLARPDIARLYSEREGAGNCGFILAIDLPAQTSDVIEPLLTVRTADGETGRRPLRVEIPPQERKAGLGDPLAVSRVAEIEIDRPLIRMHIDAANVDPSGVVRVDGWVVCLVQIERVEASIDDVAIGQAEFGLVRADVEAQQADYPNSRFSGFRLVTDLGLAAAERKTVTIRAVAHNGVTESATVELTMPEMAAARPSLVDEGFRHHCDEALLTTTGRLSLRGWALGEAPVDAIVVRLDGDEIGHAEIGLDRPDVGNLFPALAHARQPGFAFDGHARRNLTGPHVITLRVHRTDGAVDEIALPAVASEAKRAHRSASHDDANHKLYIDAPTLVDGAAETPVRGGLEIAGWAMAQAGVAAVEVAVDGMLAAIADYGLRRQDIQAVFPDRADALHTGYQARLPARALPQGRHAVSIALRDAAGETVSIEFQIFVEEAYDGPGPWSLRRKLPQAEIDLDRRILERAGCHPRFTAILSLDDDEELLRQACVTIASLEGQAYPNWRLLVVAREPRRLTALRKKLLAALGSIDERIDLRRQFAAGDLAGLARAEAPEAEAGFVTVLTAGDELGVDAFLAMAVAIAQHRDADLLYSDERRRNPASGEVEAFFKPQWSPDLLLSTNYIGRLWCARAELLQSVVTGDEAPLHHGEYDLVLRCTEKARTIHHVAAVLCERASDEADDAAQSKAALDRMLARGQIAGDIRSGSVRGTYRLRRALTKPGLVSIIIPTCAARGLIKTCLETLRRLTLYREYEIVCIENIAPADRKWRTWLRRNADRTIASKEPFNWARFNNRAAAQANGEYLLFLNDDIEIVDPAWLDVLLAEAQRPEVAAVGPQLLYPDHQVQHAGVFLTAVAGQSRHAFRYTSADDPGYFGLALTQRNVIAVTGACLMTRRDTFEALGGFEEAHGIINNDIDYCLRAWQRGMLNVYTPHTRLIHHELVSRGALDDDYDAAVFAGRWRDVVGAGDPYFSPHLSKGRDDFAIDFEPTQVSLTGGPLFARDSIRKILVVKLDHIGDCITSFPAIRRLKAHFPRARISVLTSRTSKPVWAYEPTVEQVIEFDFFHPSSAMGELPHLEDELQALAARLSTEHFDLAVDLRKHIESRPVLQQSGARYLAGYDHRHQFPWLDIALEWGGDHLLAHKRRWAGEDLVNLIDAIATAGADDRAVITPLRAADPREEAATAGQPEIWVHPTAGNDIKQWPVEYFAVVIDWLIEKHGARIYLTGAPGDEEVAAAIVERLRNPEPVTSLIGSSPLAELPRLMSGAALFVGNDSGLKHIAAGLGIPTVGIHGGTLDPREWGGVGPSAVMVARDVACSPCYLSNAADCPRNIACLRQLEPSSVYEACRRLLLLSAPAKARQGEATELAVAAES